MRGEHLVRDHERLLEADWPAQAVPANLQEDLVGGVLRLMRPVPLGPRSRNWAIASGVIGVCFSPELTLLPLRTASMVLKFTASAEFSAL
jgi:hypothetical protein